MRLRRISRRLRVSPEGVTIAQGTKAAHAPVDPVVRPASGSGSAGCAGVGRIQALGFAIQGARVGRQINTPWQRVDSADNLLK